MNYETRGDAESHVAMSSDWLDGQRRRDAVDRKIGRDDIQQVSLRRRRSSLKTSKTVILPKTSHGSYQTTAELESAIHKLHGELEKERLQLKCHKWQVRLVRTKLDHDKAIQQVQQKNLTRAQERSDIIEKSIRSLKQKTESLKKQNEAMANYLEKYRRVLRRQLEDEESEHDISERRSQ